MLINSDCTIFSRVYNPATGYDEWKRQYIPECWWFCDTKSSITSEGLKSADILKVRIYDLNVKVKKDDVIIQGSSEKKKKINTIKDLEGITYFKVITANYNRFGNNPHIKVVGV